MNEVEAGLRRLLESGEPLRPTGTCFDDAIDLIEAIVLADYDPRWRERLRLAHGICQIPGTGQRFAHAWVEIDGKECWQDALLKGIRCTISKDKADFYKDLRVQVVTLYTLEEMALENLRSNHYGPWKPEYDALTRNPRANELRSQHDL